MAPTLLGLPNEVLLFIVNYLEAVNSARMVRNVNALARVNRNIYHRINPYLYERHTDLALLWAAGCGQVNTVRKAIAAIPSSTPGRALIQHDAADPNGVTPLMHAAMFGHDEIVEMLCREGANLRAQDRRRGFTALSWAASYGKVNTVKMLLEYDRSENIDLLDNRERTPLFVSAISGHEEVVSLLLADTRVDVNHLDKQDDTALECAVYARQDRLAQLLLQDSRVCPDDQTLAAAAVGGCRETVEVLLSRGIASSTKNSYGETPLHLAARGPRSALPADGHEAVVRLLLDTGVDINSRDESEGTPLMMASTSGCWETAKVLLVHESADVNARDEMSWSALMSAVSQRNDTVVRLLLARRDLDVNLRSETDQTALIIAVTHGLVSTVRVLLGQEESISEDTIDASSRIFGAAQPNLYGVLDANTGDCEGQTALHLAVQGNFLDIVELLLRFDGTDLNAKNAAGQSPFLLAVFQGYREIIDLMKRTPGVDTDVEKLRYEADKIRPISSSY